MDVGRQTVWLGRKQCTARWRCFMKMGNGSQIRKHKEKTDGSVSCRWEEKQDSCRRIKTGVQAWLDLVNKWKTDSDRWVPFICDKLFGQETKETNKDWRFNRSRAPIWNSHLVNKRKRTPEDYICSGFDINQGGVSFHYNECFSDHLCKNLYENI